MSWLLLLAFAGWPQFRGPEALGISEGHKLPAEFGPKKNVVWVVPLPVADAGDEVRRSVRSSRWNICVLTLPPTKPASSDSGFSSPYLLT